MPELNVSVAVSACCCTCGMWVADRVRDDERVGEATGEPDFEVEELGAGLPDLEAEAEAAGVDDDEELEAGVPD